MCMFFTNCEGMCLCGGCSPLKFKEIVVQAHITDNGGRCILAKGVLVSLKAI